jgi:hypothetical protein
LLVNIKKRERSSESLERVLKLVSVYFIRKRKREHVPAASRLFATKNSSDALADWMDSLREWNPLRFLPLDQFREGKKGEKHCPVTPSPQGLATATAKTSSNTAQSELKVHETAVDRTSDHSCRGR